MKRAPLLAVFLIVAIGGRGRALTQPEDSHWIETEGAASAKTPENVIRKWPEAARSIARAMIEKYGLPHRYDDDALVWTNNGPWRKTVVRRAARSHRAGMRDADFLEQTIGYEVSADAAADLRRFDRRLKIDLRRHEISARSESERTNFLVLNLADEIARGNRTVHGARAFYDRTERLAKAGKTSRYMTGFLFKGRESMNRTHSP